MESLTSFSYSAVEGSCRYAIAVIPSPLTADGLDTRMASRFHSPHAVEQ